MRAAFSGALAARSLPFRATPATRLHTFSQHRFPVAGAVATGSSCFSTLGQSNSSANLYAEGLKAKNLLEDKVLCLDDFKGKAVLVVNVASTWGTTTSGYKLMNALKEAHGDKLEILAFPSNQFGFQEWFGGEEILNSLKYVRPGNGFEPKAVMMEKTDINGTNSHAVIKRLREVLPSRNTSLEFEFENPMGTQAEGSFRFTTYRPANPNDAIWNFEFWLIDPNGKPFKRYHPHPSQHESQLQEDLEQMLK